MFSSKENLVLRLKDERLKHSGGFAFDSLVRERRKEVISRQSVATNAFTDSEVRVPYLLYFVRYANRSIFCV